MAITSDQATDWARRYGILSGNETATGGLLDSRLKGNSAALAEYGKFQQNPTGYQMPTGIKPLNVASQNPYQQQALYKMGQPTKPLDTRITQSYDKASASLDPSSGYKQFMNPYIDEVINKNAATITRQYDVGRNRINEDFARAGGFGSTAQGVERGLLGEAEARQIGDMDANLRSTGYESAVRNAMNNAGLYGSLAQQIMGLDQYGRNVDATDQSRQLAAGDRIQQQHQAELDAYFAERDRMLGYPYQQLQTLQSALGAFPTGTTSTVTQSGNPYLSALGGAFLGNSFGGYSGGSGRVVGNLISGPGSLDGTPLPWTGRY